MNTQFSIEKHSEKLTSVKMKIHHFFQHKKICPETWWHSFVLIFQNACPKNGTGYRKNGHIFQKKKKKILQSTHLISLRVSFNTWSNGMDMVMKTTAGLTTVDSIVINLFKTIMQRNHRKNNLFLFYKNFFQNKLYWFFL